MSDGCLPEANQKTECEITHNLDYYQYIHEKICIYIGTRQKRTKERKKQRYICSPSQFFFHSTSSHLGLIRHMEVLYVQAW